MCTMLQDNLNQIMYNIVYSIISYCHMIFYKSFYHNQMQNWSVVIPQKTVKTEKMAHLKYIDNIAISVYFIYRKIAKNYCGMSTRDRGDIGGKNERF